MCGDNGDTFIATLHNVILAPDLCDMLFSIITLINFEHTCLLQKRFRRCNLGTKRKMHLLCHIMHSGNIHFWRKLKNVKINEVSTQGEISLELLHQRLGHRSTRSLLDGDAANIQQYIGPRIYPYPFCTSCQIYSMNNKNRSKTH